MAIAILYPAVKRFYASKVNSRAFAIVYSLIIYLPIYVFIAKKYSSDLLISLVALFIVLLTHYVSLARSFIDFSGKKISERDLVFSISVVAIILLLVFL